MMRDLLGGNKYDSQYFDELLKRIKTIRTSERMAYQKKFRVILRSEENNQIKKSDNDN